MLMRIPGSYYEIHASATIRKPARLEGTHAGVDSRDGHKRARVAAAAVDDVDLSAANVKLRAAVSAGDVERDLLSADEVLAARRALRDLEGERRLACHQIEGELLALESVKDG